MATNRASLSDSYTAESHSASRRTSPAGTDAPRRTAMVIGGAVLAIVSLIVGSLAIAQVWLAPAAAEGTAQASTLASWEAMAMILGGGLGFAAGGALVGIGMGRWTAPRTPASENDYTGPGDSRDMPDPPRVV